ncbi:DnaJ domain containing protein, partial [Entamoeba invadens IP1]
KRCVSFTRSLEQVGSFKDIVHIISMLRTTRSLLLRDRLIALIRSLLKVEINARKFIDVGGIDLYVELLTLVHLHSDHAIIPLQTNLLTAGVASGEWFYAEMFEEKKVKKGPVSIDQLKVLVMNKTLDEDILVWAQGMEDWKPLKDVTVLKWAILQEDTGVLTPLLFCQEIIGTLEELVTMYPSRDMNGILLRPIPRAKRLLSSPRHLPHVVQLLLTACPQIIDTSARLLKNLLEDNPPAQPKFYLTGAFLFSLMYAGSNIKEIAKLLAATHRQQRVGDAVELSALKSMLPGSLITVIDRSPDEFAARFVGEVATPEIRWGSSMRNYLIDTIAQHLGDFPSRLGSNPLAVYSFVPIAPLVYEELKGELYCGKIYLNQLCDVEKYPDFVISDPVGLLQSILRTWVELAEEPQKMSTSEACKVLGIENPDDKSKLRKAYFKLAQKYHPDRNPEGREMFEKVNEAYNQLVESGPDESSNKIAIILQSQCILYSRCIEDLSPYKYAGYGLLIPCLKDADLMSRSLELIYLTIRSSTLNVQELGRLGGMKGLLTILDVLCTEIKDDKVNDIRYILRACAVASKYEETITEIKKDTGMLGNLKKCLSSENLALVEASLECVTCYSTCDESIRKDMYAKNFLGILVHRVMGYDPTLEDQSEQTDQQSIHQMKNAIAGMSLLALKALVKIEENNEETQGVFALFTPQVGMKMRTKPVTEVLRIINSTTQTPYLLWTNKMRSELVDYVDAHLSGTLEWQPKEYALYKFPSLEKELVITSIYVRIFNEQIRTCEKLVDPMIFLRGLVTRKDLQGEWLKQQCQAIANVFEQYDIAVQFCENSELLEALFSMLKEDPEDLAVQEALLRSVKRLVSNSSCVEVIANSKVLPKFLVLLYPSGLLTQIIPLAQTVFSIMIGLQQGILRGGLLYLMNHFVNGTDLDQRVLVSQLMGKMSTTPSVGPKVTLSLGKFFPAAIVNAIKMDARGAVLLLDSTAETAELIWNPEMKRDVGQFINKMAVAFHTKCQSDPSVKWQVPDSFSFAYKELKDEIYIGGVFIRILNKNPSSPLNNPNLFTDGLFAKYFEARRDGKVDDMKMLATTAAVFYTNQPQNLEYVAGAGHLSKVIEALQMTPDETLFIILQVLVTNKKCKENLLDNNAVPLTAMCLTKVVEHNNLVADVFRSLTASYNCRGVLCFVPRLCNAAVQKNIFSVLDGSLDEKMGTTSPEIKAMVVDAVQNALTDYDHSTELNEILNQNPIWKLYSTQKHGLFLSGASSIAGYIAGPTSSGAVGLLTAAEDSSVKRPDAPPDLQ